MQNIGTLPTNIGSLTKLTVLNVYSTSINGKGLLLGFKASYDILQASFRQQLVHLTNCQTWRCQVTVLMVLNYSD